MRRAVKNIRLLAFAVALLFATGCDWEVVVDIIVPGYGGGPIIEVYEYPEPDYYYDDYGDGFFFDFHADF